MKRAILMRVVRFYLGVFDRAMRLGPLRGALVIGYGPILAGIIAFLAKPVALDPWLGSTPATVAIFALFALCMPLMSLGSRIVTEMLHHRRKGIAARPPSLDHIEQLRRWAAD